jgi:hypothetical protein
MPQVFLLKFKLKLQTMFAKKAFVLVFLVLVILQTTTTVRSQITLVVISIPCDDNDDFVLVYTMDTTSTVI